MAEAVILGVIHKLETSLVEMPSTTSYSIHINQILKEVTDELRMLLDVSRDNRLGEGSRLNYLAADVVEITSELCTLSNIESTRDWLRETRMQMINLGVKWESLMINSSENLGKDEDEEDVVGLEEDVDVLLRRAILNKEEEGLSSLLVKGMAGIGKTTLARQVYNHAAVERRAWLRLSSDLTNKEALMKLIQQVVGSEELQRDSLLEKMEHADNPSLQQMLHQHLQGMSYFIVLDNLPKPTHCLNSILRGLPDEDKGSRLLLTSCSRDNAETIHYLHEMKALDSDKSWQLFLKTINKFTSVDEQYKFPKHLEKKGRQLLAKCGGLPFAIIDAGRQKAKQRVSAQIEWEELLDSIDLTASLELLEPSYRNLDEQLQIRFLYFAFFKENTTIRVEKLEMFWAAGGLVKQAISHVDDLASESLIEVVDRNAFDNIKRCRVNPLLHRLSIKIAEEEMGFEMLKCDGNNRPSQSPRHRVMHCSREQLNNHSTNQDKHLVSLIFHGGGGCLDDAYWKSCELLKILDLEDFGLKILSEVMGTTLVELRYMGLRNNYIQEIPHSLGCLKKLEVLDIAQNFLVEVPDIIWEKMGSLHHLNMSDAICQKPLKLYSLENLKTLTYISVDDWTYEVSGSEMVNNLRKLGIEEVDGNCDVRKLFASLAKLERLYHLTLRGFRFRSMPCLDELHSLGKITVLKLYGLLTKAKNFPPSIRELTLVNSCLHEDPMPTLEKSPQLVYLKLRNAYIGREMVIQQDRFPNLRVMRIKELWSLRNLQVGEGSMRRLNQLEIDNCPYLESLPEEMGSIIHLRALKMVRTINIASKIRKTGLVSKVMDVHISP